MTQSDPTVTQRLEEALPMVLGIAKKLAHQSPDSVSAEDLAQEGFLAVLRCMKSYQPENRASFSTYASYRARGAMLDFLRDANWTGRHAIRNRRLAKEVATELGADGSSPLPHEKIAERMGLTRREYERVRLAAENLKLESVEELRDQDALSATSDHDPADPVLREESAAHLHRALRELRQRDRDAVELYYFRDLAMHEIGDQLGVTESRVSQILASAKRQLRRTLGGEQCYF